MTVSVSSEMEDENGQATANEPEWSVSDSQPLVGEWLSPPDAELRLRISERTLYRRISSGRLRKRNLEDGRIEVWVSGPVTDSDRQAPSSENGQHADRADYVTDSDRQQTSERALALMDRFNAALARQVEPLVRELADTRRELVQLAEQTGRLTERTEHLVAERDDLIGRVAELEHELTDSRATVAGSQMARSENGHIAATPDNVTGGDSQALIFAPKEPASQGRPFLGDSQGVAVEPTRTSAVSHNSRPWWRFWQA